MRRKPVMRSIGRIGRRTEVVLPPYPMRPTLGTPGSVMVMRHSQQRQKSEMLSSTISCLPTSSSSAWHTLRVAVLSHIMFAVACEMDMQQSAVVRVVFRAREWIMHAQSDRNQDARGFLSQMRAIGWGVLGEIPSRQIVHGAVTQPWVANPVFRPLPPDEFITFNDPNYVKIVWTSRAHRIGPSESVFRTETRVCRLNPAARSKFRRYWSFVSAGVRLIRRMLLGPVKAEARRRATGSRRHEAVILSIGRSSHRSPTTPSSDATRILICSMEKNGVRRFICITGIGAGDRNAQAG